MSNNKKVRSATKPSGLARAAKSGAKQVGLAATAARDGAVVAARVLGDGAKVAADAAADFAVKAGKFLDTKSRAFLDAEFAKHRPAGIATVDRLRKANRGANPTAIVELLSAEYMQTEKGASAKSEKFLAASTGYVVALNEIYGDSVRDTAQRQVLLYLLLAANSNVVRVTAQVMVVALTFAQKRFGAIATGVAAAIAWVKKNAGRLSWVNTLAALAKIENVGQKSASWIVVNASLTILGPAPATWAVVRQPSAKAKPSA